MTLFWILQLSDFECIEYDNLLQKTTSGKVFQEVDI